VAGVDFGWRASTTTPTLGFNTKGEKRRQSGSGPIALGADSKKNADSWKLETGSWKLAAGNWQLAAGSWKLEALYFVKST
jgi:hypothetical protein